VNNSPKSVLALCRADVRTGRARPESVDALPSRAILSSGAVGYRMNLRHHLPRARPLGLRHSAEVTGTPEKGVGRIDYRGVRLPGNTPDEALWLGKPRLERPHRRRRIVWSWGPGSKLSVTKTLRKVVAHVIASRGCPAETLIST